MSHIFISYSRKDIDFAGKIVQALAENNLDTWVDWKSIPKGEDWWEHIQNGIEEADAFLFLISPDSIASKVCNDELNHAVQNGKRILPIIIRNPEMESIPEILSKLNWIFCRDGQDKFENTIGEIRETIHTDYEWLKFHTELQVKALKWQRHRYEKSLLVRGKELEEAENMLGLKASLEPQPVDLQREYLLRSRQAVTRQRRQVTIGLGLGLVMMAVLAVFAWGQRNNAMASEATAIANEKVAQTAQAEAEQQARISRARELSAISMTIPNSLPQRRLLLAVEGLNTLKASDPRIPDLENNLRKYLVDFSVPPLAGSQDEQWLATLDNDSLYKSSDDRWSMQIGESSVELTDNYNHTKISLPVAYQQVVSWSFSPDGRWLAIGENLLVELWDLENLSRQPISLEHENEATALAFSPDSRWLVTGSFYGVLRVWVLENLDPRKPYQLTYKNADPMGPPIYTLAFSPDGRWLGVGSEGAGTNMAGEDDRVQIWDMENLDSGPRFLESADGAANGAIVTFSPNGRWVANGGVESTVGLWDVQNSFSHFLTLRGYEGGIIKLAFNPDGNKFATMDVNGVARVLNMGMNDFLIEPSPISRYFDTDKIEYIQENYFQENWFFIDQRWLIAKNPDDPVLIWDAQNLYSGPVVLRESTGFEFDSISTSADFHWLLAIDEDGIVKLWNIENPDSRPIALKESSNLDSWSFSTSADFHWLAATGQDGAVKLWDLQNPVSEPKVLSKDGRVDYLSFDPAGQKLIAILSNGDRQRIMNWDLPTLSIKTSKEFEGSWDIRVISPLKRWFITTNESEVALLWDMQNPESEPVVLPDYGPDTVTRLSYSQDELWLATGNLQGIVKVWDIQHPGDTPFTIYSTGIEDHVIQLEFSSTNHWLAVGIGSSLSYELQVLELSNIPIKPITAEGVTTYAFSSEEHWLAVGMDDGTIRVWNLQDRGADPLNFRKHEVAIGNLVIDPNERWLVSTISDYEIIKNETFSQIPATVLWWDLQNPELDPVEIQAHPPLAFSENGRLLLTEADSFLARSWRVDIQEVKNAACEVVSRNFTWAEWQLYFTDETPHKTCPQWPLKPEPTPIP